ncbi:MAG TPA: hypothetical protein ENI62_01365 [Gammaproteobacteria bacterium]|nr:hypothetical protein [Gammaproteobacteria bacterium]
MSVRVIRQAPPLWVLLDILMLWVLALVSMPMEERGVTYKFIGLPAGSVLFEVNLPLDPNQTHWRHFDFGMGKWTERQDISPQGRENFLCNQCAEFLPDGVKKPQRHQGLMVGLPAGIRGKIYKAFFEACRDGDCAPTLYIDQSGMVTASLSD